MAVVGVGVAPVGVGCGGVTPPKEREQEALAELEKALAEARLKGQNMVMPPDLTLTV